MKKTHIAKLFLFWAYCIPYAFFCLYADAMHNTMLFYAVMTICLALLCRFAIRTKNLLILCLGNLVSFLFSIAAARLANLNAMDYYFKPFTAQSLIFALSLAALLLQTLFILRALSKERSRS